MAPDSIGQYRAQTRRRSLWNPILNRWEETARYTLDLLELLVTEPRSTEQIGADRLMSVGGVSMLAVD